MIVLWLAAGILARTEEATQATGGGGWIHNRTSEEVERDRRTQWRKADERRDEIRRQIMAVLEPVSTETQIEKAEQSDAGTIDLAERVVRRPDVLSLENSNLLLQLIQELQDVRLHMQEAQRYVLQEEEAMVLLLAA